VQCGMPVSRGFQLQVYSLDEEWDIMVTMLCFSSHHGGRTKGMMVSISVSIEGRFWPGIRGW